MSRQNLIKLHFSTMVSFVVIVIKIGVLLSAILSSIAEEGDVNETVARCDAFTFDFDELTIGQVASASLDSKCGGDRPSDN